MKLKVGVVGSATGVTADALIKAYEVGKEVASMDCILLTGSSQGIPYEAVRGAKALNGFTVGFSPAHDLREHIESYRFPVDAFDLLVYTGFGLKGRNVLMVRSCDAVIVVSGRIGTLNEFTIAYDEGKTIGVLRGTGGTSDMIEEIIEKGAKKGGEVFYRDEPAGLIRVVVSHVMRQSTLAQRSVRKPCLK